MDVSVFGQADFKLYPTPYKDEALYRAAAHPILALTICIAPVGLARGALDIAIASASKPMTGTHSSR